MQELTGDNIRQLFVESLFDDNYTDTSNAIIVESVKIKVGFDPNKLESKKDQINDWLNQFSDDFYVDKGGGMSFLNFCEDKNKRQWTDFHQNMDLLVALGIAIGRITITPKEMNIVMPGGVPYIMINTENKEVKA
jgi:hypothetical protein